MHFDLQAIMFREQRLDRARSERRGIAIAAEMSQHHALDFPGEQLLDHGRRRHV